jgi:hypothetical protein
VRGGASVGVVSGASVVVAAAAAFLRFERPREDDPPTRAGAVMTPP